MFPLLCFYVSKLLGENKLGKSVKLLPIHIKTINPMQKYLNIWNYMLVFSTNICCDIFVTYKFINFFWNVFNSKAIKICYVINIYI